MTFENEEEKEIGRISRENSSDIVVRTSKYKGVTYVDIRHWIKMEKFVGWSKKGIALPKNDLDDLIEILHKLSDKYGQENAEKREDLRTDIRKEKGKGFKNKTKKEDLKE